MLPRRGPTCNGGGLESHAQPSSDVDAGINANGSHQPPLRRQLLRPRMEKSNDNRSPYLLLSPLDAEFDLVCVGFGPASLAIAVALHDSLSRPSQTSSSPHSCPGQQDPLRVLFLEKQPSFAWHAGMLLPGAKMQISFVKDLATLRDPRSEFTFLNYLHRQGRLVEFTNLGTFLPTRAEYEDYLRWCASFFDHVVRYNELVTAISADGNGSSEVRTFTVRAKDGVTQEMRCYRTRNVLVAPGGQPSVPKTLPATHPHVIHSSQYAHEVLRLLPEATAPYRVAVIGAGQSAAEIFYNVQSMYPNAHVWMVMRQEFLRPSDDSPFINSVFDPGYVDNMFSRSARQRRSHLDDVRATNYGVVRLALLEDLYSRMYDQRREFGPDERLWRRRILGARQVTGVELRKDSLVIRVRRFPGSSDEGEEEESIEADLVVAATGYWREAHVDLLRGVWNMLPRATNTNCAEGVRRGMGGWTVETEDGARTIAVGRDYKVEFEHGRVADGSGIWLQGCCEGTHGLSDTLLSVLATRSGEVVRSIFSNQ